MRFDFDKKTVKERKQYLEEYLAKNPNPNARDMEQMADYLIFVSEIEKKGPLLTDNRMVTVNKRETSMEGLTDKLEGGESAFHALVKEDKNMILTPKTSITQEDIDTIEPLRELRKLIDYWAVRVNQMSGIDRARARKMLIEMRKDQYAIKNAFKRPIYAKSVIQSSTVYSLDSDTGYELPDGNWHQISENTIDLWNPKHISQFLANYSKLKEDTWDNLESNLRWMLMDLEKAIEEALKDEPILMEILVLKIDKMSNEDIQKVLQDKHDTTHSQEYISSLYRNKIPQLISDKIRENWVDYIYTNHLKGTYKTCTRCGETKLALNRYFSINRTSSSKFYSICKLCRNSS